MSAILQKMLRVVLVAPEITEEVIKLAKSALVGNSHLVVKVVCMSCRKCRLEAMKWYKRLSDCGWVDFFGEREH